MKLVSSPCTKQFYMLSIRWLYVFLIITSLRPLGAIAQDSIVDQEVKVNKQYWLDYNHPTFLSETQSIRTEIAFRTIDPHVFNRFQAISTVTFKNGKKAHKFWNLFNSYQLGGGAIYTQNTSATDNFELRMIQGFRVIIPTIKLITLNNYVRLEERFQNQFNKQGWQSGYRLRYQLSTNISLASHYLKFTQGFYFPIKAELFFNLKKTNRFNDLVRISPGVGYKLKNNWRYELFVIFNRTRNTTETSNTTSDFIVRLRIYNGGKKSQDLDEQIDFQLEDEN